MSGPLFNAAVFKIADKAAEEAAKATKTSTRPPRRDADGDLIMQGSGQGNAKSRGHGRKNRSRIAAGPETKSKKKATKGKTPHLEVLKAFLRSRFDAESNLLNLEEMDKDPILLRNKFKAPGQKGAVPNLAATIWKLASHMFPGLTSLSLANNNIRTFNQLSPHILVSSLPAIQNLSLANNNIRSVSDLDPFFPRLVKKKATRAGFQYLQELIMSGNPCTSRLHYRREAARKFPSLLQLDQEPIDISLRDIRPASAHDPIVFPLVPLRAHLFENDGIRDLCYEFLEKYFTLYDSNRKDLASAYAPNCTFSYMTNSNMPHRQKPRLFKSELKEYITDASRNLLKMPAVEKVRSLEHGAWNAVASLACLPDTTHYLGESERFLIDAFTLTDFSVAVPIAVYVHITGTFFETKKKALRGFDRTFILKACEPDSIAAKAGWPCEILSDELTVRQHFQNSNVSWSNPAKDASTGNPAHTNVAAATPGAVNPVAADPSVAGVTAATPDLNDPIALQTFLQNQPHPPAISDEQHNAVLAFQYQTKLNYQPAYFCLEQAEWDLAKAYDTFVTAVQQGQVPPDAML